jgi:hypothetical protein
MDTLPATMSAHLPPYPPGKIYILKLHRLNFFLFKIDFNYPNSPPSAGDSFSRGKFPSRYPPTSDSILEYLCGTVDNEYVAHPTDCKRYAYCANGKKRDI